MDDFVWLEHPTTGNKAQFSAASAETWQEMGWRPTDAPAEPDPTKELVDQELVEQPKKARRPAAESKEK